METESKLWFSRLFRSSLESCWDGNASDVVHEPVFVTKSGLFSFLPAHKGPMSPSLGCVCRPRRRWSSWASGSRRTDTLITHSEESDSVASFRKMLVRITSQTRGEDDESRFLVDDGRRTGSEDPLVISDSDFNRRGFPDNGGYYSEKKKKKKTMKKKKKQKRKSIARRTKSKRESNTFLCTSSSSVTGWFSSEKERGLVDDAEREEIIFSNSAASSECSFETFESLRRAARNGRMEVEKLERRRGRRHLGGYGRNRWNSIPAVGIKVRESVAVVKMSMDPYVDFVESMVEMIFAKHIFDNHKLEEMLHRFLSLNSAHHHSVIIKAFSDVCHVLFSNE